MPTDISEFPELLSCRQVADIFQVTTETVRIWVADGLFEGAVQPKRQWRIPKASVLKVLNTQYG
jgi:predicted site-specific integrase-resolvase